jgi:hypothetical protein
MCVYRMCVVALSDIVRLNKLPGQGTAELRDEMPTMDLAPHATMDGYLRGFERQQTLIVSTSEAA